MKNISNREKSPIISQKIALVLLRSVLGIIFISHGVARLYYQSITDFGTFLNSQGLFLGEVIAWTITIGEIIGGLLLITGYFIRYAIVFHTIIIIMGIFLVHLQNGWFVVGHGQNGIEYSILIIAVLIYLYTQSQAGKNSGNHLQYFSRTGNNINESNSKR